MQDRFLDSLEDELDVFCVDRCCEMTEERKRSVAASLIEKIEFEHLDVRQRVWIAGELTEIVLDVNVSILDLLLEQISLVKKKYDRDGREGLIVDNRFKDVARLDQAIRLAILVEDLIEFTRRDEEEDRSDLVETLVPLLSLGALAANVDEPKRNVLDAELVLSDALGCLSRVQDVERVRNIVLQRTQQKPR